MICFFKFPLKDSLGGAEFHTLQLAKYFQNRGKSVKLFTSDKKLLRLFQTNGLPAEFLFCGWEPTSKTALLMWPLTFFIARRKFKKLLRDIPAGSIFFMQSLIEKLILTPLTTSPPRFKGGKVIWLEHKVPGRWLRLNPLKFRYLRLARQVLLTTVSHFAKQEFIKLGIAEDNLKIIYPGVSMTLSQSPHHEWEKKEGVIVGILGRLDPEKGVLDFLKNIILHLPNHLDWKILIAGEGKDKNKIKQLIDGHNLKNQIQMLGFVNDLNKFFSQISVLVYPTRVAESFGLSILETLARGIPVIASNLGAIPEIVENNKNGYLVDEQKKGWVNCLEALQNPQTYQTFSRNAFASAKKFPLATMLKTISDLTYDLSADC